VCGIEACQATAGLIHIDAIHPELSESRIRKRGVFISPKRRADAHRCARQFGKGVVNFGMNRAIGSFDGELARCLRVPASGGHAPQPLIHVDDGMKLRRFSLSERLGKGVGSLPRGEVFGKTCIIGATVPPMPKDADRQSEFLLQRDRRSQYLGRTAAIPDPQGGIGDPGGGHVLLQAALSGPKLVCCPTPVTFRCGKPITHECS